MYYLENIVIEITNILNTISVITKFSITSFEITNFRDYELRKYKLRGKELRRYELPVVKYAGASTVAPKNLPKIVVRCYSRLHSHPR